VIVALASTIVALYAAHESASAANSAAQNSAQQTDEGQLTSAISSFDEGNSSTRAIRLALAAQDMQQILSLPPSAEQGQRDALGDYSTLLEALSIYLRSHGPKSTRAFGIGYGIPPAAAIDTTAALNDFSGLADERQSIQSLNRDYVPTLDLSGDQLSGKDLSGWNLSWLTSTFAGVDLRGAILVGSNFARADLLEAHLQCADLQGADFRNANLVDADLRGAIVQGADFRGAILNGVRIKGLDGNAKGLRPGVPVSVGARATNLQCLKRFQDRPAQHKR
jgi:hypothetical protein